MSNQDKETVCDYEHDIVMYIEIFEAMSFAFSLVEKLNE